MLELTKLQIRKFKKEKLTSNGFDRITIMHTVTYILTRHSDLFCKSQKFSDVFLLY